MDDGEWLMPIANAMRALSLSMKYMTRLWRDIFEKTFMRGETTGDKSAGPLVCDFIRFARF